MTMVVWQNKLIASVLLAISFLASGCRTDKVTPSPSLTNESKRPKIKGIEGQQKLDWWYLVGHESESGKMTMGKLR